MNALGSDADGRTADNRFIVDLGPVSDPELDMITFKFDAIGNRYITFNEDVMTLEIDKNIPLGVNHVNLLLSDDNS